MWTRDDDVILPPGHAGRRARMIALLLLLAAALVAGGLAVAGVTGVSKRVIPASWLAARPALTASAAERVTPDDLLPVAADQARQINDGIAFASGANPAAAPFAAPAGLLDYGRAIDCLTAAIYYEAAGQGDAGESAVAQVILNRVRHPVYPHSVCGVVFEGSSRPTGCQFTFTCDGSLARRPSARGWAEARGVALRALGGSVYAPVGWATHYHADYVVPTWASTLDKIAKVGAHIFYRWRGDNGTPRAFAARYAGSESTAAWAAAQAGALVAATTTDEDDLLPGNDTAVPMVALPIRDIGNDSAPVALPDAPQRWAIVPGAPPPATTAADDQRATTQR